MQDGQEWGGEIADNVDEIVEKAVSLYTDKTIWKRKQENGFRILRNLFDANKNGKELRERVEQILGSLAEYRENDFIGGIMWNSSLRYTEYMSKYIELKNRLK